MRLEEIILENERKDRGKQNDVIVRRKLRDLAYSFPKEVTRVLVATGVKIKKDLHASVVHAVVTKHLARNSKLREAIAKMLLEMDGYVSANGQTWGLIGGALSAVGSVLSGIGRSQSTTPDQQALLRQQEEMEKRLEQERAKRRRTTLVIIGISVVVLFGLFMAFRAFKKKTVPATSNPKLATA